MLRVNICSEPGDWILPKCARTIVEAAAGSDVDVRWNGEWHDSPDVVHGVNYGYLERTPGAASAALRTAQFGHLNPVVIADVYRHIATTADACVAVSQGSKADLLSVGVPEERIFVIEHGVDPTHRPRLVLGMVGRNYAPRTGGLDDRKGVGLLANFLDDPWVRDHVHVRIMGEGWGDLRAEFVPFSMDALPGFYSATDYLLCTSTIEGGPMPLIEGLAHGKLMVIPQIGYAITYPSVPFEKGNLRSLLDVTKSLWEAKAEQCAPLARSVEHLTWQAWGSAHLEMWRQIVATRRS